MLDPFHDPFFQRALLAGLLILLETLSEPGDDPIAALTTILSVYLTQIVGDEHSARETPSLGVVLSDYLGQQDGAEKDLFGQSRHAVPTRNANPAPVAGPRFIVSLL